MLEDKPLLSFLRSWLIFRGKLAVSFGECIMAHVLRVKLQGKASYLPSQKYYLDVPGS